MGPKKDVPTTEATLEGRSDVESRSKRKKRRQKKKQKNEVEFPQAPPPIAKTQVPLSPRKQTLMRHKSSAETEPLFVTEAKENRKNRASMIEDKHPAEDDDDKYSSLLAQQSMDGKASLFECDLSRILVFYEQLNEPSKSSGRLLGHGPFEIFQLHNGDVTYLSCGSSFVYPLLPKLKILRIAFNQFILPLVNPERYWKIFINCEEPTRLEELERTLESVCQYRNLYFGKPGAEEQKLSIETANMAPEPTTPKLTPTTPQNPGFVLAADIPELPPLVPASPQPAAYAFPLSPPKGHEVRHWLNRQVSLNSITSAMASLDVKNRQLGTPATFKRAPLHAPRPTKHSTLSKQLDTKSELSMDSLLDEYEENILVSRLVAFSQSNAPSHAPSHAPSIISRQDYILNGLDLFDEFPSTSLSGYRHKHTSQSVRSRRSSRSELYTSVSNWMEPNRKPIKSEHTPSELGQDLNYAYKQIYQSISRRNLAHYADPEFDEEKLSKKNGKHQRIKEEHLKQRLSTSRLLNQPSTSSLHRKAPTNLPRSKTSKTLNIRLADVYNLVSGVEQKPKGGIARLFGW